MKPTTTAADFIRRGREAGADALGIAHDPEALMAMAAVQREAFVRSRDEGSLRRWRELVAEVAADEGMDPVTERWLAVEHVRLVHAFQIVAASDATLSAAAARWSSLSAQDRQDVVGRFRLDLLAPLTIGAKEASSG